MDKEVVPSPDGRYIALAYSMHGGGAAGWSDSTVWIFKREEFNEEQILQKARKSQTKGNIFYCPNSGVSVRWAGENNLIVRTGIRCKSRMEKVDRYQDVSIEYQFMPRPGTKPKDYEDSWWPEETKADAQSPSGKKPQGAGSEK